MEKKKKLKKYKLMKTNKNIHIVKTHVEYHVLLRSDQ